MDMGIAGKWALVCGASKGLGFACAQALVREGVNLVIVARGAEALEAAVQKLIDEPARPKDTAVQHVAADVTTAEGREKVLAHRREYDIVITNAGGPPPGNFRDWNREDWIKAIDANMLAPVELIKATIEGMAARGFGRIVNITSAAVKQPYGNLGLSTGARSGLTGFVAGVAREPRYAAANVTINNILPGPFDTDRLRSTMAGVAQKKGISLDEAIAERGRTIPTQRVGKPEEFGATVAFLCSAHSSFIVAQNVLIDGGAFPGTF
jgi:3-oxoacyl-[acyl-carrier protein] reductase